MPTVGKVVKCEVCHGAAGEREQRGMFVVSTSGPDHPTNLKMSVPTDTRKLCTLCHERLTGRPAQQPQIVVADHAGTQQCTVCHNPHSPTLNLVFAEAAAPAGDALAGKTKAEACAVCHGAGGVSKNLPGPSLAGQNATYFTNAVKAYRTGARSNAMMSAVAQGIKDEDAGDLAAYFAGLKCESAAPADREAASRGQAIASKCAACHGADGHASNGSWPSLAGQSKDYLINALNAYKSGARNNAIMAGIVKDLSDVGCGKRGGLLRRRGLQITHAAAGAGRGAAQDGRQRKTREATKRAARIPELARRRPGVWRGSHGGGRGAPQAVAAGEQAAAAQVPPNPAIPGYDWTKHRWAFGVDATKCIGCLRCVEACKKENNVPADAHHFRTWVERYVTLEGEETARIDSQADPVNIAASGSEGEYRFADRYKDAKVAKAFFVPKLCNHCTNPACVQVCPTGATYKTEDGVVLIDHTYCIGCQYCVQACPYGARFFNEENNTTDKCTWCYHRITKGLQPACVEVCPVGARIFGDRNDAQSVISQFIHNNRVQVLRPETGNAPNVFYVGIDEDVN